MKCQVLPLLCARSGLTQWVDHQDSRANWIVISSHLGTRASIRERGFKQWPCSTPFLLLNPLLCPVRCFLCFSGTSKSLESNLLSSTWNKAAATPLVLLSPAVYSRSIQRPILTPGFKQSRKLLLHLEQLRDISQLLQQPGGSYNPDTALYAAATQTSG